MPEIWLNYGITDVVLDIKAENLDQKIESNPKTMEDSEIFEKLNSLDLTKPMELVVLHNSRSVQKVISSIYTICEQKSISFPNILAEKKIINLVKTGLPEGSSINEFDRSRFSDPNLVFIGEMELDGLFGYETIATRLIKKFGQDFMLSAYAKRKSNLPSPGEPTESFEEAKRFSDNFEISGIEIVADSKGIVDLGLGHPSQTSSFTKTLESFAIKDVGDHKSMIISTGKDATSDNLEKSLSSMWNCNNAIKNGGLAILVAECRSGLGSEALQHYIEGRLPLDALKNPTKYIQGMEDLLFLSETQKKFQIGLVSTLPEFYVKKLDIIPLPGIKYAMEYILKTQGSRQKVAVVSNGAQVLLR